MSLQNITWQQVVILGLCIGGAIAGHYFLGAEVGGAIGTVGTLITFALGRTEAKK